MWFFVVIVVAAVGLRLAVRRRPTLWLWWTETVGVRRAWAAHAVGLTPTFGALQRAVLAEALRHRTVSVTGSVWLPTSLEVDLAEVDHEVIAHAAGPFLTDLAEVLTNLARTHEWRLDGPVTLRFSAGSTARPGQPRVMVRALAGAHAVGERRVPEPSPGPAPAPAPAPIPAPVPAPVPDQHPEARPRQLLPATARFAESATSQTVREPSGGSTPGLLLDPEADDAAPIVLGGGDRGAVIGRTSLADVVVPDSTVSAQHCRLVRTATGWCIEDLGSSNGTIVNGERIDGRRELAAGDVVGLGQRARYRVHL
jgi:hypothetical protein